MSHAEPFVNAGSASHRAPRRRAFTLLEAAFSTVLVGGLVVVSLGTVGSATVATQATNDAAAAKMLAASLLSEILRLPYEELTETPVFGLELLESALNRTTFDDVDDYRNWSESPPKYRDGTVIPGCSAYSYSVTVVKADPDNLASQKLADSGVKRIDVRVLKAGVEVARMSAVKTGNPQGAPLLNEF